MGGSMHVPAKPLQSTTGASAATAVARTKGANQPEKTSGFDGDEGRDALRARLNAQFNFLRPEDEGLGKESAFSEFDNPSKAFKGAVNTVGAGETAPKFRPPASGVQSGALNVMKPNQARAGAANMASMLKQSGLDSPGGLQTYEGMNSGGEGLNAPGTNLISTNERAMNFTRRDAKGSIRGDLRSLLSEPALSSAGDPVMSQALGNAAEHGVKIAGMQPTEGFSLRQLLTGGVQ